MKVNDRSIFNKLLIVFLGVIICISSILTAVFYVFNKRSFEENTKERLLQEFEAVSYHFQNATAKALIRDLRILASNPILNEFITSSVAEKKVVARMLERSFIEALNYTKSYQRVSFVDYSGMEKIAVGRAGRIRNYHDLSKSRLFSQIESSDVGAIRIEGPYYKDGHAQFLIGICKVDEDIGEFGGAVVINYSLELFFKYLDSKKIFGHNPIWILTPDGKALRQPQNDIAYFDPRAYLQGEFHDNPQLKSLPDGMLVSQDLSIIPDNPLIRLAISVPATVLMKDVRSTLRFFLLVFLFAIFITCFVVYFLSKYFSMPIVKLAEAADRLAKGELSTQVNIKTSGEVRVLVDSFNKMTRDLSKAVSNLEAEIIERKRAQEEVARHRDNLEELVYERTAELTETMANLEVSEKQNRILIDTAAEAGIGIVVVQDEEPQIDVIKYANSKILELTGYREEEILIKNMTDLIHPDFQEKIKERFLQRKTGKVPEMKQKVEYIGLTKDKREIPIEISTGETYYKNEKAQVCYISDISERKAAEKKLAATQKELIDRAHQSGMAEIATDTLHNVGNILNSVTTSAQAINEIVIKSNLIELKKANNLLKENIDTIEDFICNNPKGKILMKYYLNIEDRITEEQENVNYHLTRILKFINSIGEVIKAQQSYAGTNVLAEKYTLHEIIEDALTMQTETIESYNIKVEKNFSDIPKINIQKTKLVHIMINLIKNAKDAMLEIPLEKRILKLIIDSEDSSAYIKVADNGKGISKKDTAKIFTHGFTTKKEGHGFGLHSCANYMSAMGGEMWAESEGEGKGATFVLKFPVN